MRLSTISCIAFCATLLGQSLTAQEAGAGLSDSGSSRSALFKSADDLSLGRFAQTVDTLEMIEDETWREWFRDGGLTVSNRDGGVVLAQMKARSLELPQKESDLMSAAGLPTTLKDANLFANLYVDEGGLDGDKIRGFDMQEFGFALGEIAISGSGRINIDPSAKLQGQAEVTIVKWRSLLAALDLPDEGLRSQIETAVSGFASGDSVDLTFEIRDSNLMLGPLKLATLPAF